MIISRCGHFWWFWDLVLGRDPFYCFICVLWGHSNISNSINSFFATFYSSLVSLFSISLFSSANYIHITGFWKHLFNHVSPCWPENLQWALLAQTLYIQGLHNAMSFINMFNRCQTSLLIDPHAQPIYPYSLGFPYAIPTIRNALFSFSWSFNAFLQSHGWIFISFEGLSRLLPATVFHSPSFLLLVLICHLMIFKL